MFPDPRGPRRCVVAEARICITASVRVATTFVLMFMAGFACAQGAALTERAAIDMALARPAYRTVEAGRIAVAESAVMEARLPPNPNLQLTHERGHTTGGTATETSLVVSQAFDISGRRTLRRQAAEQRLAATHYDRAIARNRLIAEVRNAFADALYRDQLRTSLREWNQRIDAVYTVVSRLAKAGEASAYERRRLERERQAAQARIARAEADYGRARELLLAFLGNSAARTLAPTGNLIPPEPPALATAQSTMRSRPDLQSLVAQAEAFDREHRAAERAWLPDLTVGVGPKRVDEPARTENAAIVSVSIALPIFDRGQAAQKRASAEASATRAEHALHLERWEAELRGVWGQANELRRAALSFSADTTKSSRDLSRIAETAYRGGEASLLELLDAYRNELEAQTTALELALAARVARIELDLLSGAPANE
jgi:outer membrane protein, heavy metal efflux system